MSHRLENPSGIGSRGFPKRPVAWFLTAQVLMFPVPRALADDSPAPIALLRGVELARTEHAALAVRLEIQYVTPPPAITLECRAEMDGARRRFEVLEGRSTGQVIIRDGDEFSGFRRKPYEDVHLYDLKRAIGVRGDLAFDPRVLGLSDLMAADVTVRDCLWSEGLQRLELVGRESLKGANVWRVKAVRNDATSEYWIEEPSFRVHRRTVEVGEMRSELDSEFDPGEPKSPFPRRVVARRLSKNAGFERIYTVKSFEVGAQISPGRFTLKSMDLPVNTPVVDYRVNRIVGYWNGEGLSEGPIYKGEQPSTLTTPTPRPSRLPLIAANVVFVLGILSFIVWRRPRRSTRPV